MDVVLNIGLKGNPLTLQEIVKYARTCFLLIDSIEPKVILGEWEDSPEPTLVLWASTTDLDDVREQVANMVRDFQQTAIAWYFPGLDYGELEYHPHYVAEKVEFDVKYFKI